MIPYPVGTIAATAVATYYPYSPCGSLSHFRWTPPGLSTPLHFPVVLSLNPPPDPSIERFLHMRTTRTELSITLLTPPTISFPRGTDSPLSLRAGEWLSPRPPSARPCRLSPTPAGSSGTVARSPDAESRPRAPHGRPRTRCPRHALRRGRPLSTTRNHP